jgi:hypothetical protein
VPADLELVVDRDVSAIPRGTYLGSGRLGFEAHDLRVATYESLVLGRTRRSPGWPRTTSSSPSAPSKDDGELACARRARAGSPTWPYAEVLAEVRVGMTERAIARRLEWLMLEAGAEAASFESIVAGGAALGDPAPQPDGPASRAG